MTLTEQFIRFHSTHPEIWEEFESRASQLWLAGKTHWGAKSIIEAMRYDSALDGRDMERFKLNNSYPAFYARMYLEKYPDRNLFFLRERKAA